MANRRLRADKGRRRASALKLERSSDAEDARRCCDAMVCTRRCCRARVAGLVGTTKLMQAVERISACNEKQVAGLRAVRCAELLRSWLEKESGDVLPLHLCFLRVVCGV